ncbi:MAG TPA: aldo/keto reductase, partial [Polyangiaceae bacterium]|nr:aldo/keto reductase [Polyangiaceae bacterium]
MSAIGLGGYHLGIPTEAEAIRIMHRAIDEGITFFDNCWDYHGGESERRMGKALTDGKREKVFLMTKIDGRTRESAARQLEDSLHRLRTDRIDLVQIHEVIREKDAGWVFGEDGAIEALRVAQQAGKLRFIGFTGHKSPEIHLEMLRTAKAHDFRFDTVQMPLNVMDPHFKSFEKKVLPVLTKQHIGVLGMKPLGSGDIIKSGAVSAKDCLRYALSLPTSVVITGCDSMPILEQALEVARSFVPLDEAERVALLDKTRSLGESGKYEAF